VQGRVSRLDDSMFATTLVRNDNVSVEHDLTSKIQYLT